MYILKNGTNETRFGISVSKKVGNSIVRHRLTRLIRESIRLNTDLFESGYDIVIVARSSLKGLGFAETESALIHVSKIHGILKKEDNND
jgi:ribonuclease P protein component